VSAGCIEHRGGIAPCCGGRRGRVEQARCGCTAHGAVPYRLHDSNDSKIPLTLLLGACHKEELVRFSSSISQHSSPDGKRERERGVSAAQYHNIVHQMERGRGVHGFFALCFWKSPDLLIEKTAHC